MLQRILLLPLLYAVLCIMPAQPACAADPPAGSVHATDDHAHPAIDDRLVPIPPSRDTIVSAVWVLVIFLVLLAVLYPTAWKNVLAGLKRREERIRADIANAEESRRKAEATLREYNAQLAAAESRVREMISKATVEGEKLATSIRMKAQQEAEEAKERAQREIEASKVAAIRELHVHAANLATGVAEKILRRNLNADDQQELVRRSLEELQTVGKG